MGLCATPSMFIEPTLPTQTPVSNHRTLQDIIWSCVATMVACSWVSVHPNMPGAEERPVSRHLRHLAYVFWAIVAPEALIFWAMRQWHGARTIEKEFKKEKWTTTHGHFLQMGGFVFEYEEEKDGTKLKKKTVVNPQKLRQWVNEGRVELPNVRKRDIDDLSKTSVLARAIVTVQVLWFALQCIARHIENLPITKLELTTAALAAVNGALYLCWADKPFEPTSTISIPIPAGENPHRHYKFCWSILHTLFIEWPRIAFLNVYQNLGSKEGRWKPHIYLDRVSSYYAYPITNVFTRYFTNFCACVVGLVFAGIHCAGWNFNFPTTFEKDLWRGCSGIIFLVPISIFCFSASMKVFRAHLRQPKPHTRRRTVMMVIFFPPAAIGWITTVVLIPVYIFGRIGLLFEAFYSLRDLAPGTMDLVKWSTFIPHV
ncbi:hypothetical protein CPC08DRAFT_700419 [Agrocybe pediades]|nr:hypothetical protein CPC08DRAFT_700419 [Agrocybe pediades]